MAITKTMRNLMVDFAAHVSRAKTLDDVQWGLLAQRLEVEEDMLGQIIGAMSQDEKNHLWADTIEKRVVLASSADIFVRSNWQNMEGAAVAKLHDMLSRGVVNDPAELLALARAANQINTNAARGNNGQTGRGPQVNVQINGFGTPEVAYSDDSIEGDDDMGLPNKIRNPISIDLSPRTASALMKKHPEQAQERIIDSTRLQTNELRELNVKQVQVKETQQSDSMRRMQHEADEVADALLSDELSDIESLGELG